MDIYDKLNAMVKKVEELDELANEYDRIKEDDSNEHNKIKSHCLTQGALNAAEELEAMAEDLTDEELDEINAAFADIEADIEDCEEEIADIRKKVGDNDGSLIRPLKELAELYHLATRFDEEIQVRKQIFNIVKNIDESRAYTTLAMRDLVFALNNAESTTEAILLRRQMLSIYKQVFKNESEEDIDVLIDSMQFILKTIVSLEVKDEFEKASELYDKLFEIDIDIFEHKELFENLTPISATHTIIYKLLDLDLKSKVENLLDMFPQLRDDEEYDDNSAFIEEFTFEAVENLQCLAEYFKDEGRYKEELNTRKRIVDIYYESFGDIDTWSIKIIFNGLHILHQLEETLTRSRRRRELLGVQRKIMSLAELLEEHKEKAPEKVMKELQELMVENAKRKY